MLTFHNYHYQVAKVRRLSSKERVGTWLIICRIYLTHVELNDSLSAHTLSTILNFKNLFVFVVAR